MFNEWERNEWKAKRMAESNEARANVLNTFNQYILCIEHMPWGKLQMKNQL